jgi:hypothetical protein
MSKLIATDSSRQMGILALEQISSGSDEMRHKPRAPRQIIPALRAKPRMAVGSLHVAAP